MTRELPDIEVPPPGSRCRKCHSLLSVASDFCGVCHDADLEMLAQHEEAIQADWREARRRTRNRMAFKALRVNQ